MISTKGRYALRVMIEQAQREGEGCLALKDVARRQDISEKYLEAIMKKLVQEGLVSGPAGKGGRLPPGQAGPGLHRGGDPPGHGEQPGPRVLPGAGGLLPPGERCPTLPMWRELDSLIQDYFDRTTLAHLARQARDPEGRREPPRRILGKEGQKKKKLVKFPLASRGKFWYDTSEHERGRRPWPCGPRWWAKGRGQCFLFSWSGDNHMVIVFFYVR